MQPIYNALKIFMKEVQITKAWHHTIIKAFAMPINIDMRYMKALMLIGKNTIPAPQNIHIMAPAEKKVFKEWPFHEIS